MDFDRDKFINEMVAREKERIPLPVVDLPAETAAQLQLINKGKEVSASAVDATLRLIAFFCEPREVGDYLAVKRAVAEVLSDLFVSRKKNASGILLGNVKWNLAPREQIYPEPINLETALTAIGITRIINPQELKAIKKRKKPTDDIVFDVPRASFALTASRHIGDKFLDTEGKLVREFEYYRYLGFTGVVTKGVWDLGPHFGHSTLLQQAKLAGGTWSMHTAMVDSDFFAKIFKGLDRPLMTQEIRYINLAYHMFVDRVFPAQRQDTIDNLDLKYYQGQLPLFADFVNHYWEYVYRLIRPNILVLGDDRRDLLSIEHTRCAPLGMMVLINDWGRRTSTTGIIKRARGEGGLSKYDWA